MKLQLNESTLNAYINEAIRQELTENNMDELLGSRNRKKNIRMITGQGWGNQNRDTKNWWGAANSDISNTDAESEAPQTLVGIVTKMEKQLMELEKVVGIAPKAENLGASITQTKNNGKVKTKASLLAAINALSRIADRLDIVEQKTGLNKIMESVDEKIFNVGYTVPKPTWINGALGAVKGTLGATTASTAIGKALLGAGSLVGGTTIGTGVAVVAAIAAACFGIAQTAATIATKGRSRNIVRTFNCAAVLAKRMGNVAEALKEKLEAQQGTQTQQQPVQQEVGQVNELNVRRAKKTFSTIEQGMQQLSALMKQIHAKINGQGQEQAGIQMPQSLNTPQEIQQFQEWANANNYVDQYGQPLVPDGKFGPRTSYVYDQIAQNLGQLNESRGPINEAGGIENALKTLETKVGKTGSGGMAYADISALSGGQGQGSSRLQNAQNAKMIMRSYPPVLNQYLEILKTAGANVNNLLPLRDDRRPHRNYSVKELQAIDRRIQELIQIAQTVEINEPGNEEITLPPKPVVQPRPQPAPQPEPEVPQTPDLGDVQIEEPEIEAPDTEIDLGNDELNIDKIGYSNPRGGGQGLRQYEVVDSYIENMRNIASMDDATKAARRRDVETYYQNGKKLLNQAAENGAMTYDEANERLKLLYNYYRQCKQTIRRTPMAQQQQPQQQLAESRTRKKLNEREFKKLVRQIVLESLTR